jgi:hypothetical protein
MGASPGAFDATTPNGKLRSQPSHRASSRRTPSAFSASFRGSRSIKPAPAVKSVMGGADRMVIGGMETKALRHFVAFAASFFPDRVVAAFFFFAARLCFLTEFVTGTDWPTATRSCSATQAFRLLPTTAACMLT